MPSIRRERADAVVRAVQGNQQQVEPEQRRDLLLAVRQVFVERRARGHAELFQLDDHQREIVDEADHIRPAGVKNLIENCERFCFRGKGRMARRDEGPYPQRSVTEEQRSQTVFCAKTLRAKGLLPWAGAGSAFTARFRDAPASPPCPQPKSLAAEPLAAFQSDSQARR